MSDLRYACVFLAVSGLLCGCAAPADLGMAGEASPARESLEATGGYDAWRSMGPVRTKAVVTIYRPDGSGYVNEHAMTIDAAAGTLSTEATTGTGTWHGQVGAGGEVSLGGAGLPEDPALQQQIREALRTILHRYRGPWNVLDGTEKPGEVSPAKVYGRDVTRMGVQPNVNDTRPTISTETRRCLFLTQGADAPGENGTVTLYSYEWHRDGMGLPGQIQVIRIGKHLLVGQGPHDVVLDVKFSETRL